jgi:predicted DNA-binding transcriptional regulator AlpA
MDHSNELQSVKRDMGEALASQGTQKSLIPTPDRSPVIAWVFVMPSDAEPILSLLKQLAASPILTQPLSFVPSADCPSGTRDRWLEHAEAAEFLGIAKSTLYRYVSHQRIESRKIAGRLEYRQSHLEKLKQDHIRPARLRHASGGIILSTLNSGK